MFRSTLVVIRIALRRLLVQPWLALMTLLGVAAAIAFCTSIPLYTNTIYNRLLRTELYAKQHSLPAFGLLFRYMGPKHGNLEWEDVQQADAYLSHHLTSALNLPQQLTVRYFKTDDYYLYAPDVERFEQHTPLATLGIAFQSDLEAYITLVEGQFPQTHTSEDSPVEALISEQLQFILGWHAGETYTVYVERQTESGVQPVRFPVRVTGVWHAIDRHDPYWFYNPTRVIDDMLVVPEATFVQQLAPMLEDEIAVAMWYIVLDGATFCPTRADAFLRRLEAIPMHLQTYLPDLELMAAPAAEALRSYQAAARWLMVSLFAFSVPIVGAIIVFLDMIARLTVRRQRAEIALLRSRGASEGQTLCIAAVQEVCLGALALALGLPAGRVLARHMAQARGFLDFSGLTDPAIIFTGTTIRLGAIVACLALLGLLTYTLETLRHSITSYQAEKGRTVRDPWWQRAWLDILLLLVAAYGVYVLYHQHNAITSALAEADAAVTIRGNPLVFVIPAVCSIGLTLLALRALPHISGIIAHAISQTPAVSVLLAARQVARDPGRYTGPLILLMLTLSLAVFTASLAATLNSYEHDLAYSQLGADMQLVEVGENTEVNIDVEIEKLCIADPELPCPWEDQAAAEEWIKEKGLRDHPRWQFVPVTEHLKAPGVQAATRVGWYGASTAGRADTATPSAGRADTATPRNASDRVYVGIDRADFAGIAYWEPGFAAESLGALMNALALAPDGVLVSRNFAERSALSIGDSLRLTIVIAEPRKVQEYQYVALSLRVAGILDRFPAWSPEQGPLFVGNLDYLFREAGGRFPHQVWLRLTENADPAEIARALKALDLNVIAWDAPLTRAQWAETRPEREGILGLLSCGFLVAAGLTVLGLILYVFISFRRRAIEVGTLRAIGFTRRQVTVMMIWELFFLMGLGTAGGTGVGLLISRLLIAHLPIRTTAPPREFVPMTVVIAWPHVAQVYGLFAVLFVAMVSILMLLTARIRLFEAIKLGDTV